MPQGQQEPRELPERQAQQEQVLLALQVRLVALERRAHKALQVARVLLAVSAALALRVLWELLAPMVR